MADTQNLPDPALLLAGLLAHLQRNVPELAVAVMHETMARSSSADAAELRDMITRGQAELAERLAAR